LPHAAGIKKSPARIAHAIRAGLFLLAKNGSRQPAKARQKQSRRAMLTVRAGMENYDAS
jgi:hypothetical protein